MTPAFLDRMGWRMAEVYEACTDQILINLARHFKYVQEGGAVPGAWQYQMEKLAELGQVTRETEAIILASLGGADAELRSILEDAIREGLKYADPALRKAAEKGLLLGGGFIPPDVVPKQMRAFNAYYRQSGDGLNLVNTVMLESTQEAYTGLVSDIVSRMSATQGILNTETGKVITGASTFNQAVKESTRRMMANGITGFIDHGGHHWSPEAYVAMDIRTTVANTARQAVWERCDSYGCDLYQVSSHDGARPLCYPWQGKVLSRNGWTGVVEDDEGNKVMVHAESEVESFRYGGGLFGVNCKHEPIPFIPGFSKSRPPEQNEEENAREYAESQKQRALERSLRYEKRDLAAMKAQGASEEEIRAQRQRVKASRDKLYDFCEETGRAVRTGRIATPITPTWPENIAQ